MPLHNPAALDGFILTEEDAGGLWAHLRVDLLVSKHPRVRAIVNRLHLEIAELETHYGKNPQVDVTAGRRNIWEPAIKGTRREDVPDIAVKTWVGSSGDTYSVQRKIVTAANLVHLLDGQSIPITAARHFSRGMHLILDVLEKAELVDRKGRLGVPDDQGFIDQFDEYHNRQDAFVIAQAYGRVNIERNGSTDELYSEGLH